MHRRSFLASAAYGSLVAKAFSQGASARPPESSPTINVQIDTDQPSGQIPADFIGLGYEISSVAAGVLTAKNHSYINLVRRLGPRGVIRIGGNTADYASFRTSGQAVSAPKGTIVNQTNLRDLSTFLDATGWKLIWSLNLGGGTEVEAVEEAQAVASAIGGKLLAFEIGNEPDLFGKGTAHRPRNYSYEDYLREYRTYKNAIRSRLPTARFAGPDAAAATDWVTRFAADEGNDLKLLTHHYYRECASPTSTLDRLLHPDPKLQPQLEKLRAASAASHLPYRICEVNSLCGGGKPGVSDTLGSALWILDYLFTMAKASASGVNIETGVNQLGFISWYSPIADAAKGSYLVKPDYYGMLAFAQASDGQLLNVTYDGASANLTTYAVASADQRIFVTIVNKEAVRDCTVSVHCNRSVEHAGVMRLTGPALAAKEGVLFGGSEVTANGEWQPASVESVPKHNGGWLLRVPAATAAILTLSPK